jgi:hypothetical protein
MTDLSLEHVTLRSTLIRVARDLGHPGTLSYRELGLDAEAHGYKAHYPMTTPPFRGLGEALGAISRYEHDHGRPLISALVVREADGLPGPGFFELARQLGRNVGGDERAFFELERAAVLDFWRDRDDPTRALDAAMDVLLRELRRIRKELRS